MSPASYQTAPPRDVCPICSSIERLSDSTRAGNGTRTRDPNLGKVVLYQLSYSRRADEDSSVRSTPAQPSLDRAPTAAGTEANGGEGDRTPDLVNAIHALSQLSYAPVSFPPSTGASAARKHSGRTRERQAKRRKFARHRSRTRNIFQPMRKKKHDRRTTSHGRPSDRPTPRPRPSPPISRSPRSWPSRRRSSPGAKKKDTAANLGVYDADKDILDQYLHEVSKTAAADRAAGDRHRAEGAGG